MQFNFSDVEKKLELILPENFKTPFNRKKSIENIQKRNDLCKETILSHLSLLKLESNLIECNQKGDWHLGNCVCEIITSKDFFYYKPNKYNCEDKIFKLLNILNKNINSEIILPKYQVFSEFIIQDSLQNINVIEAKNIKQINYDYGAFLCFSLFFGMFDLHKENILISSGKLAPIDLDCAFYFDNKFSLQDKVRILGIKYTGSQSNLGSFNLIKSIYNKEYFKNGFENSFRFLKANFLELITIEDILTTKKRRVFTPTEIYSSFLKRKYFFNWNDNVSTINWKKYQIFHSNQIAEFEINALNKWNIPIFYEYGKSFYSETNKKVFYDYCVNEQHLINHFKKLTKNDGVDLMSAVNYKID